MQKPTRYTSRIDLQCSRARPDPTYGGYQCISNLRKAVPCLNGWMNIPVYFDDKFALTMSATFNNIYDDNDPSVTTDDPVPVSIGPDGKIPCVTIGAPWYSHATDNIAFSYQETPAGTEIEGNPSRPPLPPLTSVNLDVFAGAPKGPANDALISRLGIPLSRA